MVFLKCIEKEWMAETRHLSNKYKCVVLAISCNKIHFSLKRTKTWYGDGGSSATSN